MSGTTAGFEAAGLELLTREQMAQADTLAVAGGVPSQPHAPAASFQLMVKAGTAVAAVAMRSVEKGGRVLIVAGPGNNGGDGFVAARQLHDKGYGVRVVLVGERDTLRGDAATAAGLWHLPILPFSSALCKWADLIVDALYGAGLSRPIEGAAAEAVGAINASGKPLLAVDVPSGLDGNTGAAAGPVIKATKTVTFFRRKPGHLLLPGRELCGDVTLADIGIPDEVAGQVGSRVWVNAPGLWRGVFPELRADGHKFTRGHAVVVCGPLHATGAARLGARGALRIGAGLVSVASPMEAVAVNAAHLTAIQLAPFAGPRGLGEVLSDERKNAVLIGPGAGVSLATRLLVQVVLEFEAAVVLDADALTSFTLDQDDDADPVVGHLFTLIGEKAERAVVMTPHEGEFKRVFPDLVGSKLERARAAAKRSGAVVVLKGADTVVAAPDGRAAINENAPPWLATAGSGDVLAGFVTGLLAQGMPAFEAACAAVWVHGACGTAVGRGLIAEDLPEVVGRVFALIDEQRAG